MKIHPITSLVLLAVSSLHAAPIIIPADVADARLRATANGDGAATAGVTIDSSTATQHQVGRGSSSQMSIAVIPFQLPVLAPGQVIANAAFRFTAIFPVTGFTSSADVYGLGNRPTATVTTGDYYSGASGGDLTDATLIEQNTLPLGSSNPLNVPLTHTVSPESLTDYLKAQYAAGGAGKFIFLRLSTTVFAQSNRHDVDSAEHTDASRRPTLSFEIISPPSFTAAPAITPATGITGAQISATISGSPGALVKLDGSNDLGITDPWESLQEITLDGTGAGSFTAVTDIGSVGQPKWFCRLQSPGLPPGILANRSDGQLQHTADADAVGKVVNTVSDEFSVGRGSATEVATVLVPFLMPELAPDETVADAKFRFVIKRKDNFDVANPGFTTAADVYGLGQRSSPALTPADFYSGITGGDLTNATLIQADVLPLGSDLPLGEIIVSDPALTTYVNDQILAGAAGNYVFLRLSTDAFTTINRYVIHSGDAADPANRPTLDFTVIPAP